jgi:HTH-type transcriptional regulator/antitoxin HigA
MDIRPIHSKKDYEAALKTVARLMEADPEPGTSDGDALDILTTLIEAYEEAHFPIDAPDPIAAIEFRMEVSGLKAKDLGKVIGSAPRATEILKRKRRLTIDMIWKITNAWGIPAQCLVQPYELRR